MKEKLKQFVGAKRGVSPVIGVVLMVAVVVILAAVIGAFVLGLGGNQQSTPQASFSLSDDGVITMSSGDTLDGDNVYIATDGARSGTAVGGGEIKAGDALNAGTDGGGGIDLSTVSTVSIIYDDNSGNSATLWQTDVGAGAGGDGN